MLKRKTDARKQTSHLGQRKVLLSAPALVAK